MLDAEGRYAYPGSEVRVYESGSEKLLGTNILDTGSGYNSQNAMPVHFGLTNEGPVDVHVTTLTENGRKTAVVSSVDPKEHAGGWLVVRIDRDGNLAN